MDACDRDKGCYRSQQQQWPDCQPFISSISQSRFSKDDSQDRDAYRWSRGQKARVKELEPFMKGSQQACLLSLLLTLQGVRTPAP